MQPSHSPRSFFRYSLLAVALVSTLTGCKETAPVESTASVVRPAMVQTVSTRDRTILTFNGVVRAEQRADLSFRIGGRLTQVLVNEGDNVLKGQILAKLDDRDLKTALSSAKTERDNVNKEYLRAKKVFETTGAITKSQLDQLKAQLDVAQNRVEDAERKVEYSVLRAPFDGIVGQKFVDNHTQVQANARIFTAHNLDKMEVVIQVPDRIMLDPDRKDAQKAVAELSGIPNVAFPLTLSNFATQADPIAQTYAVSLSFDDLKGYNVLPGMTVKVRSSEKKILAQDMAVMVPLTAISPDNQGKQFVWILKDDNTVSRRLVHVGRVQGHNVTILSGLAMGEKIVVAGVGSLIEGTEVRPYEGEA